MNDMNNRTTRGGARGQHRHGNGERKPWTAQDDKDLIYMVNDLGWAYTGAAIVLNRTASAVANRLHVLRNQGSTISAKKLQDDQEKSERRAVKKYHRWASDEKKFVKDTLEDSAIDVAYALGRTVYAVNNMRSLVIRGELEVR